LKLSAVVRVVVAAVMNVIFVSIIFIIILLCDRTEWHATCRGQDATVV